MDETTISLDPLVRACWSKRGQQRRIPATHAGVTPTVHLFGGYTWNDDTVAWTQATRKNSDTFIQFLEHLLVTTYPHEAVMLVLDNASYHRSAAACAAMSLFEHRVQVYWLPPYCPDLNPIERFWRYLKDQACANQLKESVQVVQDHVVQVLTRQNTLTADHRFHVSRNV